jgi:hypothetical protein
MKRSIRYTDDDFKVLANAGVCIYAGKSSRSCVMPHAKSLPVIERISKFGFCGVCLHRLYMDPASPYHTMRPKLLTTVSTCGVSRSEIIMASEEYGKAIVTYLEKEPSVATPVLWDSLPPLKKPKTEPVCIDISDDDEEIDE